MMSKKMIKFICVIMAVLMALSACAALVSVFAVDEGYYETYVNPKTGDNDGDYLVPAGIAVAAILAIIICIVLPKMKKNTEDDEEDEEDDNDDEDIDEPKKSVKKKTDNTKPQIIKKDSDNNK